MTLYSDKLETSLIDDARVIIYDCHMFIVKATDSTVNVVCKENCRWQHVFWVKVISYFPSQIGTDHQIPSE